MLSKKSQLYLRRMPFFLGIMAMTQFASCEKDDAMDGLNGDQSQEKKEQPLNYRALFSTHHTIGVEEAKEIALDASSLFDGGTSGLKVGKVREIGEIRVLQSEETTLRSGSGKEVVIPDTLAYLFNFADSTGYAIICADDRVGCPVLAFVSDGTLGEMVDNPGQAIVLANMEDYLINSIREFEETKDSLRQVAETRFGGDTVALRSAAAAPVYSFTTTESVSPLISTRWNQSPSPYNDYMPVCSSTGQKMYAGCTITAAAQVMAYYQYPAAIDGWAFNWPGMKSNPDGASVTNSYDRSSIGALMYFIGQHVGADYSCSGTGASPDKVLTWLRNSYGYQTATFDYSWGNVKAYLDARFPLMMKGFNKRIRKKFLGITYSTTYDEGHTWVIDGYVTTTVNNYSATVVNGTITGYTYLSSDYYNSYLHINWGWGGDSDQYYAAGCFAPVNQNYNFYYNQKVYVAVH
ncbi:MAG: C10 family peptidase [Paludibacteraceae bacterium]|nr:C10 family peptidase [Paludibacteraceae bacterium]